MADCARWADPPAKAAAPAKSLFDGKTLDGWKKTAIRRRGRRRGQGWPHRDAGRQSHDRHHLDRRVSRKSDYEISLEAMRVDGSDFFCGLTFPVGDDPCSFIVGGWGGGVVGLSSIDGSDASENETTKYQEFESGRWYTIRVRVTQGQDRSLARQEANGRPGTKDRRISIRPEVELSRPLGISCFSTTAALRDIKVRSLGANKP